MTEKATPTQIIDNERTLVTEWHFTDGAETGWHTHEYDYVVVPMDDGQLDIETADGTSRSQLQKGAPYFRPAGARHNVINASGKVFSFIELEYR